MTCAHCHYPSRSLWTFDAPPEFEELAAKNYMGLCRCPKCAQLWCGVPYEPHASFWFWVAWPYSAEEWHTLIEREDGRLLGEWHEAAVVELHVSLPSKDRDVVEAWRRRAYGFTPIDHRVPRFIRQTSDLASLR
jgi:hypothetical protein